MQLFLGIARDMTKYMSNEDVLGYLYKLREATVSKHAGSRGVTIEKKDDDASEAYNVRFRRGASLILPNLERRTMPGMVTDRPLTTPRTVGRSTKMLSP